LKKNDFPISIAKKREKKNLLRKKKRYNHATNSVFYKILKTQLDNDKKIIEHNTFKLYDFLCKEKFVENGVKYGVLISKVTPIMLYAEPDQDTSQTKNKRK